MNKYFLSADAKNDIKEIAKDTIKRWGKEQAHFYIDNLYEIFSLIGENPQIGRLRRELGEEIRSFPQGSHVIFFIEHKGRAAIVRVLHGARDFQKIFDR
ncbi:ParE toxin protein [hydrothermal vent metagenome]|uniref:ParE toxin protein n=1 Tax=hydrothermal vent metagenome TaxID=652676 RepID=A0A3B1AVX0_9ZZZZ